MKHLFPTVIWFACFSSFAVQAASGPVLNSIDIPVVNVAGYTSSSSPPDATGDVGPDHFVQAANTTSGSIVYVYDKDGGFLNSFMMESLASSAPCTSGYTTPRVLYDRLADRWVLCELPTDMSNLCVYVSQTPDPLGSWYTYCFSGLEPSGVDQGFATYSVWPDGYYVSAYNGGWVHVLEREKMLLGQPASVQSFNIGTLPGWDFQLTIPATFQGADAPPAGSPGIFMRQKDTEIHGSTCVNCDLMEMWTLSVDWETPSNSVLVKLPGIEMPDWDQTLCGETGNWNCMPQPNTSQKLDPIREPLHYPVIYRNFTTHEAIVGTFAVDVDGTDHAAVYWFELRRTPAGTGSWALFQSGTIGGEVGVHRAVSSAAMDSSGNIAVGYTRTGTAPPYFPSIYYSGRFSTDTPGTMPYYDMTVWDATNSKTNNERWGDYVGFGVDPEDDCTFWFTTEYGCCGATRIAAFRFDGCRIPDFNLDAEPLTVSVCGGEDALYSVEISGVFGFSEDVTLSTASLPAGTSGSFSVNPVAPGGTSLLTLSGTGAAVPGDHSFEIVGTSASAGPHQITVFLNISVSIPGQPETIAPVDGSTGISLLPAFDWDDTTGSVSWDILIASDPDFNTIVDSAAGLTSSEYSPAGPLSGGTFHYWRVAAVNGCGENTSPVRGFRTLSYGCDSYQSSDVPKSVTDNIWTESSLVIAENFSAEDVDVEIGNITHTYDSDLDIYIRHPDTAQIELSTDNGGGGDNYINTVFDDDALTSIISGTAPFTGSFRPEGILGGLNGKPVNGSWTLRIYDDAGGDTGSLDSWSLKLCGYYSVTETDYSDLPAGYGAASHTGAGLLRLGPEWTPDDNFGINQDSNGVDTSDDGVSLPSDWSAGQNASLSIVTNSAGWLAAWFDWNADGDFSDTSENAINSVVSSGANNFVISIPVSAAQGPDICCRFRFYPSDPGVPLPYGEVSEGEVEDYIASPLTGDSDGDGYNDNADCAPGDNQVWAVPGAITDLELSGGLATVFVWSEPGIPGCTSPLYDLLRSTNPSDFGSADCLESNETDLTAGDLTSPSPAFYYCVRVHNSCGGNMYENSDSVPRNGTDCP